MALSVQIRKRLHKFALDVDFEAEKGTLGLLGASGCGKSMTLKCIAGIEQPDAGRIVLDGRVLFDSEKHINLPPQKRKVGYLFQNYALFPNMTVGQNIAAGIRRPKADRVRITGEKIRAFYLDGLENKPVSQLSGGQQQRVALARILASEPDLILLDEPFSAVDNYLRWQLELELTDTLAAFGGIAVLVSHDRDEIFLSCGNVCVIDAGKSEPVMTMRSLMETPGSVGAARLSGCKNFARAEKAGETRVFVPEWNLSLTCREPVPAKIRQIGMRAHAIRAASADDINRIPCAVTRVMEDVFSMIVMVLPDGAGPGAPQIRMVMEKKEWENIRDGVRMTVSIAPQDILCLI